MGITSTNIWKFKRTTRTTISAYLVINKALYITFRSLLVYRYDIFDRQY